MTPSVIKPFVEKLAATAGTPPAAQPEKPVPDPLGQEMADMERANRMALGRGDRHPDSPSSDTPARVGSQNRGPEDSRVLFAQLVEERNLLKQQIALLEEKLAQQNELLTAAYRERDEFRQRFQREQRQSNQLKRALESVVERTAETRPVDPLGRIDLTAPLPPRTDAGKAAPTPQGWGSPPTKTPPPTEPSPGPDDEKVVAPEPHPPTAASVPNNVVLLRPLAESLPLSPAAMQVLESQPVELDNPLANGLDGKEPSPEPAQPPLDIAASDIGPTAIAETVSPAAPPLPQEVRVPDPAPAVAPPPRPRPMLPAFASRSQPVGAKFLNENPPPERPTNRRRPDRPELDCSERPERPVGGQVAPPPFWQDLQKNTPPKSHVPASRKRVTAFAAIQLPDFPPLR
ncbi:MAG: hypothetical protein ACUVSQ_07620 [Pseudanabaenaceae cyanobacterium]